MRKREVVSDIELVEQLRRAASIWFKNDDLLLLEELIHRYMGVQRHANLGEPPVK